jgi:polyphosphate kinase
MEPQHPLRPDPAPDTPAPPAAEDAGDGAPAPTTPTQAAAPDAPGPSGDGAAEALPPEPPDHAHHAAPEAECPPLPQATEPAPVPPRAPLDHPALYFNRELSWLDFNWRVFAQALDHRLPLLERLRFLAIASNNLDEFYRKRVGGLKRQLAAGVRALSPDGRTAREQLDLSTAAARRMHRALCATWEEELRPALAAAGLVVRTCADLTEEQRDALSARFRTAIFPILTPLAVDSGHPFPFISNLSLSLAVTLRHPLRGTEHFARLKVPTARGRWIPVPGEEGHVIAVEEVIRHNLTPLFRGMEVVGVHAFRVTRNADVERNEEEAEDLLELISEELRERKFAEVVRLEVEAAMPERVRGLLLRELDLEPEDVLEAEGLIDLTGLFALTDADRPDLKFEPWEPVVPVRLRRADPDDDYFAVLRRQDLLVHHPFESFAATTQRFVEEAALDPRVLAIKMTLYRTSRDSPIVRALIRAAENGKQVAALIEVKARFDEENNIAWAERLEKAGVHVTYGLVGLKTHGKVTLVVREDPDGLRTYCHLGTGNYNPSTARVYTDFGLLTACEDIGSDVVNLFHYLTGFAPEQHYRTLVVAPRDLRGRFLELIEREIAHQRRGGTGRIIAKMNAIDDLPLIQALYRASQEGVRVDLIVRGHCRLRPGLPGYSDNVRVLSLVGRFLEHSRIYHFHNDGEPETYLGSADWQRRNLDDRVEVLIPVRDDAAQGRLVRTLAFCLDDNRLAWDLGADGRYLQRHPAPGDEVRSVHDTLMERTRRRVADESVPWDL